MPGVAGRAQRDRRGRQFGTELVQSGSFHAQLAVGAVRFNNNCASPTAEIFSKSETLLNKARNRNRSANGICSARTDRETDLLPDTMVSDRTFIPSHQLGVKILYDAMYGESF